MTFPNRRSLIAGGAAALAAGCASRWPTVAARPETLDLSGLEAGVEGRLGVSAMDARTRRRLSWRGDERFGYCSTFKLFLAAATLERVQRGEERLDRAVPVTAADMVSHAPTTGPAVGSTLTVEALCRAAAELSDNPAANLLLRAMGGPSALQAWYAGLGDRTTRADRWEPELNLIVPGDPRDTAQPDQTVLNLDAVLLGDVLQRPNRARLERWLTQTPTGPKRLKAGVPAGWVVRHKTGTWAGDRDGSATNDIGVLLGPRGESILIAAHVNGSAAPVPEQEDAIAGAARRVLAAFNVADGGGTPS